MRYTMAIRANEDGISFIIILVIALPHPAFQFHTDYFRFGLAIIGDGKTKTKVLSRTDTIKLIPSSNH